jgi:hypothetical protein
MVAAAACFEGETGSTQNMKKVMKRTMKHSPMAATKHLASEAIIERSIKESCVLTTALRAASGRLSMDG